RENSCCRKRLSWPARKCEWKKHCCYGHAWWGPGRRDGNTLPSLRSERPDKDTRDRRLCQIVPRRLPAERVPAQKTTWLLEPESASYASLRYLTKSRHRNRRNHLIFG